MRILGWDIRKWKTENPSVLLTTDGQILLREGDIKYYENDNKRSFILKSEGGFNVITACKSSGKTPILMIYW